MLSVSDCKSREVDFNIFRKYPSLSSGMVQIVDHASDAFDCASKNMGSIRMQTGIMFGKQGHVQDILMCLQDPRRAKISLMSSMTKFRTEMEKCVGLTKEIEGEFDKLVHCARELNRAMANEMTSTQQEEDEAEFSVRKAKAEEEIQKQTLQLLQSHASDVSQEFNDAKEVFQKTAKKGEWSALALGAVADVAGSVTGIVNAAISVVKDTPKLAIETVKAIGRVRSRSDGPQDVPVTPQRAVGLDPALLAAEQIETQLQLLNGLLNEKLFDMLKDGGSEIIFSSTRLQALRRNLGDFSSKHCLTAIAVLDGAIDITRVILDSRASAVSGNAASEDWQSRIDRWRQMIKPLLEQAVKLRSFAAAQPGQGFGGGLDNGSSNDLGYVKVLKGRQQKLFIMRAAMKDAQDNLRKTQELQLSAQTTIIQLAKTMSDLKHNKATMEETKKILRKSIDAIVAMQDQFRTLAGFFNMLANIITIYGMGHAERYLSTIQGGVTHTDDIFTIAYNEAEVQAIRETMIVLRGHFAFVATSADLYQNIAGSHINPCLRMAASLPLSATIEEQEKAKGDLKEATDGSAEAIKKLAQQELEKFQSQLVERCEEIEGELETFSLPALEYERENLKAIEEGVKESNEELADSTATWHQLYEEIADDI